MRIIPMTPMNWILPECQVFLHALSCLYFLSKFGMYILVFSLCWCEYRVVRGAQLAAQLLSWKIRFEICVVWLISLNWLLSCVQIPNSLKTVAYGYLGMEIRTLALMTNFKQSWTPARFLPIVALHRRIRWCYCKVCLKIFTLATGVSPT